MRTILITGAGRGFGRALSDVFARRGWVTFPLVRKQTVAAELQSRSAPECHPIIGDVSTDEVIPCIREVLGRYTRSLDLLVNNAGNILKTPGVVEMRTEELEEHLRVHCLGALRCTRASLPFLRASDRATVINVTSRKGLISLVSVEPLGRACAYRIAKCAQNMLTVCLDKELRPQGIRVFPVHPGRLMTDVAPPDADTPPELAAAKFADWVDSMDRESPSRCIDLMGGATIPW